MGVPGNEAADKEAKTTLGNRLISTGKYLSQDLINRKRRKLPR
jgi:hypothetical protein